MSALSWIDTCQQNKTRTPINPHYNIVCGRIVPALEIVEEDMSGFYVDVSRVRSSHIRQRSDGDKKLAHHGCVLRATH